jgi:hypothetical protein
MARPQDWGRTSVGYTRKDKRFPNQEYIPNLKTTVNGASWSTNRWGMRDRDYTKEKPEGVYRIALLGDSNSAGYMVAGDDAFEYIVEERLNQPAGQGPPPCQILNFSVAGYGPYARLQVLRQKVNDFHPDALLCVSLNDLDWMLRDITRCLKDQLEIPDRFVTDVVEKAGVSFATGSRVAEHRLKPYALELVRGTYARMVEHCRAHGIRPLIAFLPRLDDRQWLKDQLPQLIEAAQDAGFTVLDLTSAYDAIPKKEWDGLRVAGWDAHPNPRGHELIARLLHEKLKPLVAPLQSGP